MMITTAEMWNRSDWIKPPEQKSNNTTGLGSTQVMGLLQYNVLIREIHR